MQFTAEGVVESSRFVLVKIVLFAGGVANEVQEEFEEGSLVVVRRSVFGEGVVENRQDGCEGVLKEDV